MRWLRKVGVDGFLIGLALVVVLAWLYPDGGARGGWMQPKWINSLGVALVFFLSGAKLPAEVLKRGFRRWRIHLLIQSFTYLVFPALGFGLFVIGKPLLGATLSTGVFFLCALPSTVTSSVALISAAEGDVPLGVFNASLSTALGVVLTPFWLAWVVPTSGGVSDLLSALFSLFLLLIGPLVIGQLLRNKLQAFLGRRRVAVKLVDRAVILLLVHTSFCNSFKDNIWSAYNPVLIVAVAALSLVTFLCMTGACSAVCHALGLDEATRRAVMLVGSQKSLAVGVPMSQVLFGDSASVGLILLPLMIYHPLQLAISGLIVQRWTNRQPAANS